MELFIALGMVFGIVAGHSNAVKKCEASAEWCKAQSAKIQPAPEQDLSGG